MYGKDEYPLCDTGRYTVSRLIFHQLMYPLFPLTKVLMPIRDYLTDKGQIVALIKPQFEAGRVESR